MGLLLGKDVFVGEATDAALTLFIEDADAGAIGAENPVGQVGGQFGLEGVAALAAKITIRQGFGATVGAGCQFQFNVAVGALHRRSDSSEIDSMLRW
jgi:hypothetical protein